MNWKRWGCVAVVAAAGWGCGNDHGLPKNEGVQKRIALESFGSCDEVEHYLEDEAVLEMKSSIEQTKESIRRQGSWWGWGGVPVMEDAGAPAPSAAGGGTGSSGPKDYTTTNNQVAGVDEGDFVKNDGTRIFVVSGNTLYLNQSWPADQLKTLGTLAIEGYPSELFLDGNQVVVISNVYLPEYVTVDPAAQGTSGVACDGFAGCGYGYGANATKLTVVDVSDMTAPKVTRAEYLPGSYLSGRKIGSAVRVVLSDYPHYPADVRYWPDYNQVSYSDKDALLAALDKLIPENEKKIRARSLEDWLPAGKHVDADGSVRSVGYRCQDIRRPNAPSHLGILSVATLNLASNDDLASTTVLSQAGEVYASATSLYVAAWHYWWWPEAGQAEYSYVHKFDISEPDRVSYVASGSVEGHVVDQFSMDEHDGYLRVATNVMTRRAGEQNEWWWRFDTTNKVSVLAENEGRLEVVGQTPELAPGEAIQSSRFLGTKGYVVTFLQTDPLFTLDLSNPRDPKVVGELKVPGFSTYIHPIDETHLLTIGTYVPENPTSWTERTLQLSIFDVSDFAHPVLTHTEKVGTAYSWSEAMWNHKAFNYFPAKKLLAIPFSTWDSGVTGDAYWSRFDSSLKVYGVDATAGFTAKGALSFADLYREVGNYGWYWWWMPTVRRSIMADDFVYAISDAGIRSARVDALSTPLATVKFAPGPYY